VAVGKLWARRGHGGRGLVGIIECAAAAFARAARQITGCTPTASYIDERTAVVEVGMVMAGPRKGHANPSICPFTLRQRLDRKEAAVNGFLSGVKSVFISGVKSECDGECSTATRAATTGLRYRPALKRRCQVSVDSHSSERPRWARGVWSSPTGPSAVAEKAWAGAAVGRGAGTAGRISAHWGANARWGPTSDRGAAVSFPYALKLPAFLCAKVPFTCSPRNGTKWRF
jgi:hypothetical protein